jgi:hypothetical protein
VSPFLRRRFEVRYVFAAYRLRAAAKLPIILGRRIFMPVSASVRHPLYIRVGEETSARAVRTLLPPVSYLSSAKPNAGMT